MNYNVSAQCCVTRNFSLSTLCILKNVFSPTSSWDPITAQYSHNTSSGFNLLYPNTVITLSTATMLIGPRW